MTLRLGLIGLSPGNGHPYSWAAIFNGYDTHAMESCEFSVIPRYLENQTFPEDCIPGAKVTHIWTQNPVLSQKVASASLIPHVVNHYNDLIGAVDAVLLARDDAENHLFHATKFLQAGIPIYIDKPLALSVANAENLLSLQKYEGQLFSCSALRYATELELTQTHLNYLGEIRYIHATIPKDWNRYSIHLIDPVLKILGDTGVFKHPQVTRSEQITTLHVLHDSGVQVHISAMGDTPVPIVFDIAGSRGILQLRFENTFMAFRNALSEFIAGVVCKQVKTNEAQLLRAINLVEAGAFI